MLQSWNKRNATEGASLGPYLAESQSYLKTLLLWVASMASYWQHAVRYLERYLHGKVWSRQELSFPESSLTSPMCGFAVGIFRDLAQAEYESHCFGSCLINTEVPCPWDFSARAPTVIDNQVTLSLPQLFCTASLLTHKLPFRAQSALLKGAPPPQTLRNPKVRSNLTKCTYGNQWKG